LPFRGNRRPGGGTARQRLPHAIGRFFRIARELLGVGAVDAAAAAARGDKGT
jgi:hypothetical protein